MSWVLEAPVLECQKLPRNNWMLKLRAPEIARTCLPGQFVMASKMTGEELPSPLLKRALAIYSTDAENGSPSTVNLLIKVIGDGTRQLAGVRPGDAVSLIGPLGHGFEIASGQGRTHLLAAGGVGIASVYLLAERLASLGEEAVLFYGGRTAADLVCADDFRRLNIPVFTTTDDGSEGFHGLITGGLDQWLDRRGDEALLFYTCGPNPMMQAVTRIAKRHQIPCQISVEARMGCGFGVCLGCTVKTIYSYRLACRDGPVFDGEQFVWEEENLFATV